MKLSYFSGYVDKKSILMPLDSIVELIRSNAFIRDQTKKYRYLRSINDEKGAEPIKSGTPCFAVAALFHPEGKAKEDIKGMTGLSLVDIDHIPAERLEEVIQLVNADVHTLLSYTTISGCGLRILYRIEGLTNEPVTPSVCKHYSATFHVVNQYYAELTGCECDLKCKNVTRLSGLAHDPNAYFNPNAIAFDKRFFTDALNDKKQKGCKVSPRLLAYLRKELTAQNVRYEPHHHNEYIMRMGYLMNAFGVNPEAATKWAVKEFSDYDGDVTGIFRSCYLQTEAFGSRSLPPKARKSAFASAAEIERFLNGQAQFRFNLVTGKVEYSISDTSPSCHSERSEESENAHVTDVEILRRSTPLNDRNECWAEIDDRFVNSLWSRMCKQVKPVKTGDLRAVLASEFVPPFNPFESYFSSLPPWDGQTDYIAELADTVTVKGDEQAFFVKYFKKWLVNMVASLLDAHILNHEILVFIGPQGCYKTTWMSRLLPPELERYFYIKANSTNITKDDHFTLSEFAIICLEELDAMASPHTSQLKALVSKPDVNERPAYGHYKERRPHLASFCGTTNNEQFLTDLTGNRRWLPIEVEAILNPHFHPVNYTGVYSQALALFRNGFPYYLSPAEVQEVNLRNRRYEVPCMEVELVQMLFIVPFPEATEVTFLTVTQILNRINLWSKHLLNPTKIGIAMKRAGFTPCRKKGIRGYRVIELPADRIQANAKLLGA